MLNGPASAADTYGPSVMPFIGLEAAAHKQQLWEWDAIAANTATQQPVPMAGAAFTPTTTHYTQQPFYNDSSCTLVDCSVSPSAVSASSSPSPFPQAVSASFPFYQAATHMVPDYQQAFLSTASIKAEDVDAVSCADGVVAGAGRIGLNLGRRTYFSSGEASSIDGLLRRSRGFYGHQYYGYGHYQQQVPRCQAEGCKADLSGAKHYHRRHKVCEFHSKAAVVITGGAQQRFCQQCSRFHVLGEFDETKRSCRKRLAEHNRRRRKPQTQQQQPKPGASASTSSPATTATVDAPSSPGSTADVKSKHVVHNGGLKGLAISPNAQTTASMTATASSSFITFSAGGDSPSAEAHLRASVTGLSLGGMDANGRDAAAASTFGSDNAFHDQSAFLFTSEEKGNQQYHDHFQQHRQQQQLFSSSSSSNTFAHAHHNFFCSSSNDASQSTTGRCGGGGSDQSVPRSSMLHLGQSLFDVDFME